MPGMLTLETNGRKAAGYARRMLRHQNAMGMLVLFEMIMFVSAVLFA
jgi:hypothetical protein